MVAQMSEPPTLHRWNSLIGKDAYINISKAKQLETPRNLSFLSDGSLKDVNTLKQSIDSESGKFFMSLELTGITSIPIHHNERIKAEVSSSYPNSKQLQRARINR